MNINSKVIIASTLFTALLTGTSAYATDDMNRFDFQDRATSSESVFVQKVSIQSPAVDVTYDEVISGKK